ncbi:MAG: hypothetical protein JWN83_417 [Chitinophagaceae bacterium]|nr:hypothetical protein [Chitinophagaceae bacterium]
MKLKLLLSVFILSFTICSTAQDANKAFAITGNGDFQWMNIRQIDLATGAVTKNIFEKGVTGFMMRNIITGKEVTAENKPGTKQVGSAEFPTATMVAAAAYDKKHDKLFFSPMFLSELRWLDLSSNAENPKFYTLQSPLLSLANSNDEANHFTRMTIGADGNGYALTNDGNHLIKFTTGKKIVITDLGNLIDASLNNHISVHNKCSSWGGDMVADALGNLYLFTASKNVFKIDLESRIATHLGSITGLSGVYTLNGAAVDNDDNVIISSANTFEGFYKVNMKDLAATKLNTTGQVYNASDLANGNLLFTSQVRNTVGVAPLVQREVIGNQFISIYPNPVFGSQFKVTFDNRATGEYNIAVTDIQGKVIMSKQVFVKSAGQVETIQMKTKPANGMYLIKVTNANKKSVFADKIVID